MESNKRQVGIEKKNMELNLNKSELSQLAENYKKNGWITIKDFFSKKEVNNVKKKINNFLKKNYINYKGRDINFVGGDRKFSKINTFHRLHDYKLVRNLAKKDKIKKITQSLLTTKNIELRASELFAKPKNYGLKVPIHQDNYYWNVIGGNALTVWIALSPSSKINGGIFLFQQISQKRCFPTQTLLRKRQFTNYQKFKQIKKI